ncbi:MAG: folylpolyglutamate synthase/dihydrofolate synthase family protein [Bacteroidia bacterium]|nr:bifunctional folylpolyglutamate synthase/dihydrofolate synthase [Bacteroidia bacterium]MDW8157779.1 folylpolyglutamate synthase/dihydrofolate synthase family protein [Bacteroidia bacterium]
MTFEQAVEYLYSLLPAYHRIGPAAFKKDLINIRSLCQALGEPQNQFRSIHVGGTNGKGSVSSMLASIFFAAGYSKVGLYTSPHLRSFTERIKINGIPVAKEWVVEFIQEHKSLIESIRPSFFELSTAMAFSYFAQNAVDYAIIEVGLGGRLDSTNIILATIAVITNISYDHMEFLGDTLAQIAFEKAGIIKPGIPVVIGEYHPETFPVFEKAAQDKNAPLYLASNNFQVRFEKRQEDKGLFQVWKGLEKWPTSIACDLAASYQAQNIQTVLQVIDVFNEHLPLHETLISREGIYQGLANVRNYTGLRGRWDIISQNPMVILDVAHNQQGIFSVIQELRNYSYQNLHIVIGFVKEKKLDIILPLLPKEAQYYLVQPNIPRGLPAVELAQLFEQLELKYCVSGSVVSGLLQAQSQAHSQDLILVTGSLFVVAEALDVSP